jgi:preprotein translocase subunit SecG
VRWQALLMPYTGLIEAVLLAVPAFLSLLLLLQRSNGSAAVANFGGNSKGDVK